MDSLVDGARKRWGIFLAWGFCLGWISIANAQVDSNKAPTPDMPSAEVMKPMNVNDAINETIDNNSSDSGDAGATMSSGGATYQPPLPDQAASAIASPDETVAPLDADRQLWRLQPFGSFGVTYDDNIFISHTDRESDVIFGLEAGLAFELGDFRNLQENYLIAEYAGTGYIYTIHPDQDAFDQDTALRGQYRLGKLTLQLDSRYQYLTGSDRNVGNFANRNIFDNTIRGIYDYSDKTSFYGEFYQGTSLYQEYLNQYNYRLKAGMGYQLTGRINLGFEGVAGILNVEESPLQYYQQLQYTMRYEATGKLTFKFSGGVEFREFQNGERPLKMSPVFDLGLEYKPFDGTTVDLDGYMNSFGSTNFVGQNYEATGVALSAQQRLFSKFFLGMAVSYENDRYYATANNVNSSRRDNYIDLRPSFDYRPLDWLSAGIFYEFRTNDSTFSPYSFYDDRTGFEMAVQF